MTHPIPVGEPIAYGNKYAFALRTMIARVDTPLAEATIDTLKSDPPNQEVARKLKVAAKIVAPPYTLFEQLPVMCSGVLCWGGETRNAEGQRIGTCKYCLGTGIQLAWGWWPDWKALEADQGIGEKYEIEMDENERGAFVAVYDAGTSNEIWSISSP